MKDIVGILVIWASYYRLKNWQSIEGLVFTARPVHRLQLLAAVDKTACKIALVPVLHRVDQ